LGKEREACGEESSLSFSSSFSFSIFGKGNRYERRYGKKGGSRYRHK
jgi:hypothetical protein